MLLTPNIFTHPQRGGIVVVPHPKKDLPPGTVRCIRKQAGVRCTKMRDPTAIKLAFVVPPLGGKLTGKHRLKPGLQTVYKVSLRRRQARTPPAPKPNKVKERVSGSGMV